MALGNFSSKIGGHLILWNMKLVIEFPHGSTILILLATITHFNISVEKNCDAWLLFTQYCPGGLFCFVNNGFHMQETLRQEDPAECKHLEQLKSEWWKLGLVLLATLDNIKFN